MRLVVIILIYFAAAEIAAQQETIIDSVQGYRVEPKKVDFDESLLKELNLPEGFKVDVYAKDLGNARMMAVDENGFVYVTCPKEKHVMLLIDKNNDGKADETQVVAEDIKDVHGITIKEDKIFFAAPKELYTADIQGDGTLKNRRLLIDDLPDGGQHPNRTLAFAPDGRLFLSVGSSCNACEETNEEHATILVMDEEGKNREVFAKGLRNTIGFGWHPETKEMWGMDHGSDMRGDEVPPEELNKLEEGNDYGWPFCYGNKEEDKLSGTPEGSSLRDYCANTIGAVLLYQAHSAPIDMIFYNGNQFPDDYKGDALVAMRGSWNKKEPAGYKLVRLKFNNGQPEEFEDFVTGFLNEKEISQFGRIAGLAELPDGSILLSEDTNGVIYRISYDK